MLKGSRSLVYFPSAVMGLRRSLPESNWFSLRRLKDCHISLNILFFGCNTNRIIPKEGLNYGVLHLILKEPCLPTGDADLVCWNETYFECKIYQDYGVSRQTSQRSNLLLASLKGPDQKAASASQIQTHLHSGGNRGKDECLDLTIFTLFFTLGYKCASVLVHADSEPQSPHTHSQNMCMWASVKS